MSEKIKCPECGYQFDAEEALSHELEKKYKEIYQEKLLHQAEEFRKRENDLEQEKEKFNRAKERENELFQERLDKKVAEEKKKLEEEAQEQNKKFKQRLEEERKKIMQNAQEEAQLKIKQLEEENEQKKVQLRQLQEKELDLLKKENELRTAQEEMELKLQKQLLEKQQEIEESGRMKERQRNELKEKEYQKVIDDLKKSLEDSKRKAEQGSMQLQGEIQELAIEDYLNSHFPFDRIEEIKKGQLGGDCIQHVNTRDILNCGSIYYESKRTKSFSEQWIDKLKADIQSKNALIGVIVTETMPNDMTRLGMRNGIWVCNFEEFKGLAHVLRESLIMLKKSQVVQENKGDKMSLLYDYLTSHEFKMQIETIVEGFTAMRTQLDKEKRAFHKQWKEREKQIDRVIESTSQMYGSIRGIAGNSLPGVQALELDFDDDIE